MSPEHGKGGKKEGCPLIPPLPPGLDHLPVSPPLPPRPPPKLERTDGENMQGQKQLIKTSLLVTGCMIGGILLAGIVFTIMNKYCSRRNRRRRRNPPAVFETQDDFLDEDHGPVLDHPIWYINAIGLQQSVIDSITVCKYQKDEGLIDGIECSICLSEFEEDETLRLLPKCSHAFHLPCIDTWLRSHKNCPLCRAPILSNAAGSPAAASEPRATASASTQETQVENLGSDQVGEDGTSQVGVRDEIVPSLAVEDGRRAEIPKKSLQNSTSRNCHSRVQNNLVDHQRDAGEEILPLRRSVSLDSSSASMIYHAVANVVPDQGSQKSQLVPLKNSSANVAAKPDGGTSSKSKLMQSSSSSRSLQKGPSSMKRSFSSSRKFFSSRQWKSGSSILPL